MPRQDHINSRDRERRSRDHGDAVLMGFVAFLVEYVVMVAHTFPHYIHWIASGAAAVGAYLSWLAWCRWGARWRDKTLGEIFGRRIDSGEDK